MNNQLVLPSKYIALAVAGVFLIATYWIIKDYITILLSAGLVAYAFLPLKQKLQTKMGPRFSVLAVMLLILLVLFLIIYFLSVQLISQITSYLANQSNMDVGAQILSNYFSWLPSQVIEYIGQVRRQAAEFAFSFSLAVVAKLPQITTSFIIFLFLTYYLMVDWQRISQAVERFAAFERQGEVLEKVGKMCRKIIYGYSMVAAVEFGISLVGFYIAGSPVYAVLALIVGLSAFVPVIGPLAIWFPVFIFYLLGHNYFSAIVILVMGFILTGLIDHFLGHVIIGRGSKIHPVIMLLGILGGIPLFGLFGFILGPLTLILCMEILREVAGLPSGDSLSKIGE